LDTESPSITCPSPIVVDASGPDGVAVPFTVTASDNCSVAELTAVPAPGSVFPVGTTTVSGAAIDPSGNGASCSFTIHVKGAAEQVADLVTSVDDLATSAGIRNALLAKLDAALDHIQSQSTTAACGELEAFINQVEAQAGQAILTGDASALVDAAARIRAVLGC
jgi:hypothetical protein